MGAGIGGHQRAFRGRSDTWLTPPSILDALGPFDLDPCCPPEMPWRTAALMVSLPADGLSLDWSAYGRVWLNPPYGPETERWLAKLADSGRGTALVFARTETAAFHAYVWSKASAALFLSGRLHFHRVDGQRAKLNAGGPSVLVAYGDSDAETLRGCRLPGRYIDLRRPF